MRVCLVAVAAVTIGLVSVGAADAATTKLCRQNEEFCSAKNTYTLSSDNFKGTLGFPVDFSTLMMVGLGTVSCPAGKLSAELSETKGPLTGKIAQWNGFSCTPEGCSLAAPSEPAGFSTEVVATGKGNGTMTIANPTIVAKCASPAFTCNYSLSALKFSVQGGLSEKASMAAGATMSKAAGSGLACPATASYESFYTLVEPSGVGLYVTN